MIKREAINWNELEDTIDKATWEKLTMQFWLDTRIPVSNDLDDWRLLTDEEKDTLGKVLAGLTLLDTIQSVDGVDAIRNDVRTPHETAVLNNIQFMESVHAKSYSTIFTTLMTNPEVDELFKWVAQDDHLGYKNEKLMYWYTNGSALQRKATSVLLESFLFYSGFYAPLHFLGHNKLANVAEIIKLIIKDESVHGTYIGYKYKLGFSELATEDQEELTDWVYDLLMDLYDNEVEYTKKLYDPLGLSEDVIVFLQYNANKALANLGLPQLFPGTVEDVNPLIMNGLSGSSSSHDFFSQVGNSYFVGEVEAMTDRDYDLETLTQEIKSYNVVEGSPTKRFVWVVGGDKLVRLVKNPNYKEEN